MKFTDSYQKKIAKNHLRIISMKCRKHKNEVIIFIVPKNIKKKKKKQKKKTKSIFCFLFYGMHWHNVQKIFYLICINSKNNTSNSINDNNKNKTTAKPIGLGFLK